ncbi:type VI secretion system protein TssA [Marivita sp. S0852]|uniref:type VI secretion system protein TssA n=1 Tax=Marivita sp. S0852 TaxID=3373893 RepID=UPI0039821BC2
MTKLSDLFVTHGDDAPSGENLEYDPDFTAMELAAQAEEERQAGDEIVEGKDPDFKDLAKKARVVLGRSHDIRAAVHLANSELRLTGLEGFADAVKYIRFCLEDHWDTCHPQLDEDDDDDPTMRINAVTNLAERSTVLRGLRRSTPLSESRSFGGVTLRDIEIANGEAEAKEDEDLKSSADIEAAFMDTDTDRLRALHDAAKTAFDDINALDAVFMDKTPGYGPSLEPLQKMMGTLVDVLSRASGADLEAEAKDAADEEASVAGQQPAKVTSGAPGQITSRADVAASLDKIIEFYNRNEPSSPIPVLLKRARRLVGADFMTIINDLAPLGVENVHLVGGVVEDQEEEYE